VVVWSYPTRVLHRNGNGKIPHDYHWKTARMVISAKSITAVTAGMGIISAVQLPEWDGISWSNS